MKTTTKHPRTLKFSTILAYVLEHRKPYPLPDGWNINGIRYDIGTDFGWHDGSGDLDERPFCSMSKTAFARHNNVDPAQVSRWLAAGMPETRDGRLNWGTCWQWLDCYKDECERRRENGWRE